MEYICGKTTEEGIKMQDTSLSSITRFFPPKNSFPMNIDASIKETETNEIDQPERDPNMLYSIRKFKCWMCPAFNFSEQLVREHVQNFHKYKIVNQIQNGVQVQSEEL